MNKTIQLKKILCLILILNCAFLKAQKIESIYVHLYTDSLKKGTYNYINIDGLLSNGSYLPLDSSEIIFSASAGKFYGNSLWIDPDFKEEKVNIKVVLRTNPALHKEFVVHIKKKLDNEKLKTTDEIISEIKKKPKRN